MIESVAHAPSAALLSTLNPQLASWIVNAAIDPLSLSEFKAL